MRDMNQWELVEEGAVRSGCSTATIWRKIREGKIRTKRVWGRRVVFIPDVKALAARDESNWPGAALSPTATELNPTTTD